MARQMGCALAIVLSLASGGALAAQSEDATPRQQKQASRQERDRQPWWLDEKLRTEVGFSLEQAAEIGNIHKAYREQAVPLRKEVDDLDKTIEKMIVARDTDMAVFKHTVEKVEARRAELNKARTILLYKIRRVFTPEQNAKFQAVLDRRDAERRKQDDNRRK